MPGYPLKITDAGDQKSRLYFAFITQYLLGTSALVEVSLSVPICIGQGGLSRDCSALAQISELRCPHWNSFWKRE
jgi:hypothetical protein